tara:strand:+ start:24967 stop:30237 length:5271 start_codon:yes stop_codon:yes gene_type:complete
MANLKSNVKIARHENLWIIDPNGEDSTAANLEDLNISVELEVLERGEEYVIYSDNKVTTGKNVVNKTTRISFIDGADSEEKYLTTHYTELNTSFNDKNKDLGTLGIESIDISFNSSYVPIVKIRFKDIRGRLLELGDDSPYAFLFRMPYPIFYLTVKGYYGKPVQYALHMTKFNGKLDNETGSFIITCDFIGYSYAFLTDLLMGILKGIPYTNYGKSYIDGVNNNDDVDDIDGFITIPDLINIIGELEKYVTEFRRTDPVLKALTIYDKLNTLLLSIEGNLDRDMKNIFNEDFKSLGESGINTTQNMYRGGFLVSEKMKIEYENSTLTLVKNFNTENSVSGDVNKYNLNVEDFQLDSNGIFISVLSSDDFFEEDGGQIQSNNRIYQTKTPLSFTNFQQSENINTYNIFKITGDNAIDDYKEKMYDYTIEYLQLKTRLNNNELRNVYRPLSFNLLDIRLVLEKINILKEKLKNDFNENKDLVTSQFSKLISDFLTEKGGKFDSSIGSLFKILCDHVDLFIKVIKKVETNIESDRKKGNRNLSEASKGDFSQYKEDGSQAYVGPFPEYIENEFEEGENALVEKWLGSNDKFSNFEEVIFIEDLYNSMLKEGKKEKLATSGVFSQPKGWFPVNPLETVAFDENNKNPWEAVSNSNIQTVMKFIIQRMAIYLSYTNKTVLPEEVAKVAEMEANQLYNVLINVTTKKGVIPNNSTIDDIITQIKLYYGNRETSFGKVGDNEGLRLYVDDTEFIYHHDKSLNLGGGFNIFADAFIDKEEYIPLNQDTNTVEAKENLLNDPTNRASFNSTFISNILSNNELTEGVSNKEEKETFIKIINKSDYSKDLVYDNYVLGGDNAIVSEGSENSTSLLFGGRYRTHEFLQYQNNTEVTPLFYQFYDKSIKTKLINRRKAVKNEFIFDSKFRSEAKNYSLFGSRLYYNQKDNYSKALLFLHSIPFEGLIRTSTVDETFSISFGEDLQNLGLLGNKTLKFFNERGAFISVPNSWILFMGGLLYRESKSVDIFTFRNENNESVIPNVSSVDINTDEYLIYSIISDVSINFNDSITSGTKGQKISEVIKNLPISVKNIFIKNFINWVEKDWLLIKNELEIFEDGVTDGEVLESWDNYSFSTNNDNTSLKANAFNNYKITKNKESGNFDLKIITITNNNDVLTNLSKKVYEFFNDEKILINGTYRIWEGADERLSNFKITKENETLYIDTFFDAYKKLNTIDVDPESEIRINLWNTDNVDDIKLGLYKNVKSIFNKWIIGVHPSMVDVITGDLYSKFNFMDRAHADISGKLKVSPTGFIDFLTSNANISFYNFIARILRDNNLDFIPLPTFIDYSSESSVASIFDPVNFSDMAPTEGPQFICMYFGEQSNRLNIDKKTKKAPSDSFHLNSKYDSEGNLIITNSDTIPKDFKVDNQAVPYVLVNYADQNQSIFKNIQLDQSEFTETNESLEIIDSLANVNRNNSIGQNLFDIYSNRSYSAEVEMLGCAQIQPFMFFQVNNVPVFDGAYTIINTRHHIKPNHMTTTFKGVRIRRVKTKMVDDETLYAHLLANLNEIDNEGASLLNLTGNDSGKTSTKSTDIEPKTYGVDNPIFDNELTPIANGLTASKIDEFIASVTNPSDDIPLNGQNFIDLSLQYNIPLELALLQGAQESNFGTKGAATRTFNIYNVNNITEGDTLTPEEAMRLGYRMDYGDWVNGFKAYSNTIKSYIPDDGNWVKLLDYNKFRRKDYNARYAATKDYEGSLRVLKRNLENIVG